MKPMKVVGWLAVAAIVTGVLLNLSDIRRYIKIEMM